MSRSIKARPRHIPNPLHLNNVQARSDDESRTDHSELSSSLPDKGIVGGRSRRQLGHSNSPLAIDDEGTRDVFKDCLRKLENAKGSKQGIEIDITEEDSIDWKSEQAIIQEQLSKIEQQHSFIPRIGELVLWIPSFLEGHYLMLDPVTNEFKYYSYTKKTFRGFPSWRGGIVTVAPSAMTRNGMIDFHDILDLPEKSAAPNTSAFRVETMSDPNDDFDKSSSKQYRYVPLRSIRPLCHWQQLLKGIPQTELHPSILYALTCLTSISMVDRWRFRGEWPNGRIFCRAIFLGSELITVGDAVRLLRQNAPDEGPGCTDVLVVTSIRYNLMDLRPYHVSSNSQHLCSSSHITLVGYGYTTDASRSLVPVAGGANIEESTSISHEEVKSIFRCVGANEFGPWYTMHYPHQKLEVSHEKVLGRLHEADAVRLWTGLRQHRSQTVPKPRLDFDVQSIISGRQYGSRTDDRLEEPRSETQINWHLADTRADGLALASFNGMDVGHYHEVRNPETLKSWRIKTRIADGRDPYPEVGNGIGMVSWTDVDLDFSQHIVNGKKAKRTIRSRVIKRKSVLARQMVSSDEEAGDIGFVQHKPSSQMAGAALVSDVESSQSDNTDSLIPGEHDISSRLAEQEKGSAGLKQSNTLGSKTDN